MSGDTGYKIWSWLYMSYFFRCCLGFILKIMCFMVVLAYLGAVANEFKCNKWDGKGTHRDVHCSGYCNMGTEANVLYFATDCIWNVMAHAQKPDFVFRRNGRVHLNWRGASVQSTTGSRGVRINGSNAGYTMFRGNVKSTGYPLHLPVSPSLPLPCITVCHHISTGL